jgi:hypothetical protein
MAMAPSMIENKAMVSSSSGCMGRPAKGRWAIAQSVVAKAVFNMSAAGKLPDRLSFVVFLRRICGWEGQREIPMNRSSHGHLPS